MIFLKRSMPRHRKIIAVLCALSAALIVTLFRMQIGIANRAEEAGTPVEQGRHLVEHVGLCADCHSPRGPAGDFDRARWLQGAPVVFKPVHEMPWASHAPGIAGSLAGYNEAQLVTFLTTGMRPDGRPCLPPMPAYRFSPEEAQAVAAYLQTLPSGR